jgi:arylesterase / paraoxonase
MPSHGFSSHGMDVVPSSSNPEELFLYLVNHRAPVNGRDARVVGADSVIEVFKTVVGSRAMVHHATFEDPLIMTPNDIVGSPDGKSFHITNYFGTKTGTVSNHINVHVPFSCF